MSFLTFTFVFLFFLSKVSSQSCSSSIACPSGLTCCLSNFQCYNANNKICCGALICDQGASCTQSNGYSSCTTTTNASLSAGAIAGIVIALIVICCCIPIGVFLCCFGGLAMLGGRNNPPPNSQLPVYAVNHPPPGQHVNTTNLPPGYVQGQGVPANDGAKIDQVGVASAPNM